MDDFKITESRYRPGVRIGNWYEEICLEEDEILDFLEKQQKNELLVQKVRFLYDNLLRKIELAAPFPNIRFGSVVQLVASDVRHCPKYARVQPCLSLNINERHIYKTQNINEKSDVTLAPSEFPCVRNTFIIKSADSKDRTSELLKYGQEFVLQCVAAENQPLVLYSSPKTHNLHHFVEAEMAIHNPVGICVKYDPKTDISGEPPVIPSGHARWKCQHINRDERFLSEGEPVPSNSRLLITHCATNENLAVEDIEIQTFFGRECLVSTHNFLDIYKREKWQNIWTIAISNSQNE